MNVTLPYSSLTRL